MRQRLIVACCLFIAVCAVLQITVKSLALLFFACQLVSLAAALYGVEKAHARPRHPTPNS